jgi:hypothetical protein
MHFAIFIPDWNSLESVRRAHSDLEGAALVFFALLVLFDILANLSKDLKRKTLLEKTGLCFFAVAVLAEIAAYPYGQRNDELSANMIGSLSAEAAQADAKAKTALTDSGTAITKAGDADSKAETASDVAGNAQTLARGARTEADSFEKDIVSAKAQAAKAENDLADALQRAANAEREIAQIKLPRALDLEQQQGMGNTLSQFKGQSFSFLVFGDPESLSLLGNIDAALKIAEWSRVPTPTGLGGDIGYTVNGVTVPSVNDVGLDIFAASDDVASLPAAIALADAISKTGIPCKAHSSEWLKSRGARVIVIRIGKKLP